MLLRRVLFSFLSIVAVSGAAFAASRKAAPLLVMYVFPQNAALTAGQVDAHSMTRINYAFANIEGGRVVTGFSHDAENFAFLTALRKENPELKVLVSVGGWLWSCNFSDAALTKESRARFIDSAAEFIAQNQLDGLDIDWEYPARRGAGYSKDCHQNPGGSDFRPEDTQNFTALLGELRARFDVESKKNGRRLLLTLAAGASPAWLEHTEMNKVARAVDTVNLMAYDYYEPGSEPTTGHHAALYTNPNDPKKESGDASVRAFEKAGVPADKLVLGVPFYGHAWGDVPATANGLYQPGKPAPNVYAQFGAIQSSMIGHGYTRFWDPVAKVPYLYNAETRTFVSYEDPESLKGKCAYVHEKKLAGMMVWDLESDDAEGTLLKALNACLRDGQK
ncbi:glycoside hydrolase family 18 protein [Occallatibacter riparius]|uniref:chitinase n=1 Tax=Occallatibacter riparius TaxID=1002689 RepID=A0A9J7BQF3_9BACT|nr:glycoside hydrolase family 18 protein [Occallatibacter riparius]UWZ85027.1 glycoside hydrolase family 18 protein [Occallatibacter riparius]